MIENMSIGELRQRGRRYDAVNNEGGYGYNPYWAEIDRRETAGDTPSKNILVVRKGNQYSPDGYTLQCGPLHGYGSVATRMDGTVGATIDGNIAIRAENRQAVEAVILAVLTDGLDRAIDLDTQETMEV